MIMLLTYKCSHKGTLGIFDSGINVLPFQRLIRQQPSLPLPVTEIMKRLQHRNVCAIGPIALELTIDAAVMIFRNIDSQIELDVGKSFLPCFNGRITLAYSFSTA